MVAAASFADHSGSRAEYLAYQAQVALLMLLRQTAGGRRVHGAVVSNVRIACCLCSSSKYTTTTQRVVGVAEVSVEQVPQALAGPCMLPKGVAVAIVSNMAVLQPHRRQGLGRRLLQACYKDAVVGCAVAMLLYVRKDNGVAAELYASEGFEPVEWTDPEWLAAAHRGEVGGARRLLLIRRL